MADVGQKRGARLPKGPKPLESSDEIVEESIKDESTTESRGESQATGEETNNSGRDDNNNRNTNDAVDNFQELKRAKIPEPPSKTIRDPEVLYDYLASLKQEHWIQLSWYMYRIWPQIVKEDTKYIECNVIPIDEDYILKNHGSGEYSLILNDSGKPKNAKTICKAIIKLNNPDYPPMVNMQELDTSYPGNRVFVDQCIAKGLLTVDKKPMNTQVNQGGQNNDQLVRLLEKLIDKSDKTQLAKLNDPTDTAINKAFEVMARGNQAATEMMLGQMKQEDPEKLLKLVSVIAGMVKPTEVQHKNDDDSKLMKFLEIMNKKDETIMNLMTKMIEKAQQPPVSNTSDDNFDKMLDRYMKLQELTGMVGGGQSSGKKSTLEVALQYGAPVLDRAFGIIQNIIAAKAVGVNPGANNPVSVVQSALPPATGEDIVQAQPDTQQIQTNPQSTNPQQTTQQTQPGGMGMQLDDNTIKQGLIQMAPMFINALDRGQDGSVFADGINNTYGPQAYDLISGLGFDKIMGALQENKQIWGLLAHREIKVKQFIKEFIDYGLEEDEPMPPNDNAATVENKDSEVITKLPEKKVN